MLNRTGLCWRMELGQGQAPSPRQVCTGHQTNASITTAASATCIQQQDSPSAFPAPSTAWEGLSQRLALRHPAHLTAPPSQRSDAISGAGSDHGTALCLQVLVRGLVKALTHHHLSQAVLPSLWCFQIPLVPDQRNRRDAAANSSLLETAGIRNSGFRSVFLITNFQRAELPAYESGALWKIALWGLMGLSQSLGGNHCA